VISATEIQLSSNILWEKKAIQCHINQILLRMNLACYAIKVITPLMSEDTLKIIYYSYVHWIITYSIIFWGNSPHNTDIFKIQKRIIQIMTKSRSRDSCRQLFKCLEILPYRPNIYFLYYYLW
jgi:hypothetical protein